MHEIWYKYAAKRRRSATTFGTILVAMLSMGTLPLPASADNNYFESLAARSEVIYARSYRKQSEIDADVPTRPENRETPPVYDPVVDGARWTVHPGNGGIVTKDQMRPHFPHTSTGSLLFYWEARWDKNFPYELSTMHTHKAFQLSRDTSGDQRRIEIRTRFNLASAPDVAEVDGRSYIWSPEETPMSHQVGKFTIKGDTWTRFWAYVDFDRRRFSLWVADEKTSPKEIYRDYQFNDMTGGLDNFWFEFNSSQSRAGGAALNIWARNFVVLRNVGNVEALIEQGGKVAAAPEAPRNVAVR